MAVNLFTVALFAVLLVMTLRFVDDQHTTKVDAALKAEATALASGTAETLRTSVEALRAVASLLTAIEDVDFAAFSNFARRYLDAENGLLILEWQPRIIEADRATFVEQARRSGLPKFRLWEPNPEGQPMHAKARPVHVPVYYMLAKETGTDTTGLDLAWSDERMASKWLARDSGQPRSSGFFPVVTGSDSDYAPTGLAITLPIFHGGLIPESIAERQAKLHGYLAGVYALEALLGPQLDELAARGFNVRVSDGSDSNVGVMRDAGVPSDRQWQTPLTVFGNDWRIELTASQHYLSSVKEPLWTMLPAVLVVVGVLVLAFLHLVQRNNLDLQAAQEELGIALARVKESELFLRELSRHDPLTGVHNRRAFLEQLAQEVERGRRHHFSSTLMMLDIDHFKRINDAHGHPTGDEVLKVFTQLCQHHSRTTDMLARLGGEEFGILLPQTELTEAAVIAERIRETVAEHVVPLAEVDEPLRFTVSIGLASTEPGKDADDLLSRADKALYRAKQDGRNVIRTWQD